MNRNEVLALRRQRADLIAQARKLNDEAPNGVMDAERSAKWEQIMGDAEAIKGRIDREERLADEEANLERSVSSPNRPDVEAPVTRTAEQNERAFRAAMVGPALSAMEQNGLELPRSARELLQEYRAQSVGTAAAGGYTVPQGFMNELEIATKDYSGVLQAPVSVVPTDGGNDLPWPSLNDTSTLGELTAENTAVNGADLTFSSVTLKAYKYDSGTILLSFELIQDSAFNFDSIIGPVAGERIGRKYNVDFTTGSGTGAPKGIVTAATLGVTTASATAVTFDELLDLIHSVDPSYRRKKSTGFMFNDSTLKAIKKLKDSQNRPLFLPGYALNEPDTINGYPFYINQDMASMATGNKFALFGDFSKFKVRRVKAPQLFVIRDKYIEQGSVGYLVYSRADANLIDAGTHPIKYMKNA